jgi:hypothetical protein
MFREPAFSEVPAFFGISLLPILGVLARIVC